jgi:hypothetical protein
MSFLLKNLDTQTDLKDLHLLKYTTKRYPPIPSSTRKINDLVAISNAPTLSTC